jgi:hypothetical protein
VKRWLLVAMLAGCGSDPQPSHALGMNDVSILMPLPTDATTPVLMGLFDRAPLVDPIWFDAMVFTRGDLGSKEHDYFNDHSFHVVAVRVDLCDRVAATPCPEGVDGRLRLVAQPIVVSSTGSIKVLDIGIHLFYPIPAADLAGVIDELRELAAIQATPDGPLHVSLAAAAGNAEYLTRLRTLVARYATAANLVRFTANGQKAMSVGNAWLFRELDRSADGINYRLQGHQRRAGRSDLHGRDRHHRAHRGRDRDPRSRHRRHGSAEEDRRHGRHRRRDLRLGSDEPRDPQVGPHDARADHVLDVGAVVRRLPVPDAER